MRTADWQDLYDLTEHWKSDLAFYQDEIQFLDELISDHFLLMIEEGNILDVEKLAIEVKTEYEKSEELERRVTQHLTNLRLLKEAIFRQNEESFRDEHQLLEDDIVSFTLTFRSTKRNVFSLAKRVLKSEKTKHLGTKIFKQVSN